MSMVHIRPVFKRLKTLDNVFVSVSQKFGTGKMRFGFGIYGRICVELVIISPCYLHEVPSKENSMMRSVRI